MKNFLQFFGGALFGLFLMYYMTIGLPEVPQWLDDHIGLPTHEALIGWHILPGPPASGLIVPKTGLPLAPEIEGQCSYGCRDEVK